MSVTGQGGYVSPNFSGNDFVMKYHRAKIFHYDFRILCHGRLISWMLPNLPVLKPGMRSTAIIREDHNPQYMYSERRIPDGTLGAGPMVVTDLGKCILLESGKTTDTAIERAFQNGVMLFRLRGQKLSGEFRLVQCDVEHWFIEVVSTSNGMTNDLWNNVSVVSGLTIDDIESEYQAQLWMRRQQSELWMVAGT